jgi:hypothetical protein
MRPSPAYALELETFRDRVQQQMTLLAKEKIERDVGLMPVTRIG